MYRTASRLTLVLAALMLTLIQSPSVTRAQTSEVTTPEETGPFTCISHFGVGEIRALKCERFSGRSVNISIGQLSATVADKEVTDIRLVSDNSPDEPFDLSPLAGADHIRSLNIYREGDLDLTPLLSMAGLKSLSLSIDAARALPQLAQDGAQGPKGLVGLRLYIPRDTVDLTPLRDWDALRLLNIKATAVTGTKALATLTRLSNVTIEIKEPADFTPLGSATGLRQLSLRGVLGGQAVSDIGFLANLTDLRSLALYSNRITDLAPLSNLTKLRTLILSKNTALEDLAPLERLTDLRNLQLRQTRVTDITPLHDMSALRILWISGTPLSDISVLANMPEMFGLELTRTNVSDLTPLEGLKNLQHLNVKGAQVSDFSAVPDGVKIRK
ncbi:leucine-rich repeat domain-containing protein [Rhodalgimonas zhirmunskyi]|uniref:Leucine-rich repeat domain-containing protein n=1 Tax=Rhodalgimonas zhirmunskyi TaxID=2964767 RepID=A0AAJ1UD04_9RHOB|nr:leucine-rich repeat domain-containing protein [Rhodoalgimonas zhirmunskyi]MDQ2095253.1 leucine-rich repeat domain-containing protein [Rhodoalgimonas zhirmunskyi]